MIRKFFIIFAAFTLSYLLIVLSNDYYKEVRLEIIEQNESVSEGVFSGKGAGFAGDISVEVFFARETSTCPVSMRDIIIKDHEDVANYMAKAKEVIGKILKQQSCEVEVITGATQSSKGIIEAVRNARKKAGFKD